MRTRNLYGLYAQFDRITKVYGYDNPHRETARQIFLRYKHNIGHTKQILRLTNNLRSMLTKTGSVMKRFENDYKESHNLMMSLEFPYDVYGRVEYEWYAGTIYNGMRFKTEEDAREHRNMSLVKYPNCEVDCFKYVVGIF